MLSELLGSKRLRLNDDDFFSVVLPCHLIGLSLKATILGQSGTAIPRFVSRAAL